MGGCCSGEANVSQEDLKIARVEGLGLLGFRV